MDRIADIAVFVQVVDQGSFTAAATRLELSKGAVSKYVQRLEKRLGARLLNRTTRRLTMTEAGAALYERVSGALADIEAAETEIMELTEAPRGRLRVTAPAYFGNTFLLPAISKFLRRYPELELELDLNNRIVDLVAESFDLAIRITTLTSSSLVARRLAPVPLVTVASPEYLARNGTPTTPADLRQHTCIHYTLDRPPGEWPYQAQDGRAIAVRVSGPLRCNSDDAIKLAVLDNLGIARFPDLFVRDELASGRLVRLLNDYELAPAALCAVFPSRSNLPPKVRVFVDFLAQHLARP